MVAFKKNVKHGLSWQSIVKILLPSGQLVLSNEPLKLDAKGVTGADLKNWVLRASNKFKMWGVGGSTRKRLSLHFRYPGYPGK